MFTAILTVVWAVGWVASIYPINRAIVRGHVKSKIKKAHDNGRNDLDADREVPVVAALMSTALGMFWPLAAPFVLSYLLFTGRVPDIDGQLDRHVDNEFAVDVARRQMADARKELQSSIGVGELVEGSDWATAHRKAQAEIKEIDPYRDYREGY